MNLNSIVFLAVWSIATFVFIGVFATYLFRQTVNQQTAMRVFWGVFVLAVTMRFAFMMTYPLNNMGGDTPNYYQMITEGKGNLVHPSGYPLIAYLFTWLQLDADPTIYENTLLILQHGLDLFGMVILYFTLTSIYDARVGAVASLTYGLSVFNLSWTSSIYPEWLQSTLLVFSLGAAYFAFRADQFRHRLILYTLAGLFFVWCVFVKFNAFVLVPLLILIFIFDSSNIRQKLFYSLSIAVVVLASYWGFSRIYMVRSTGTHHLTADKGWVLMSGLDWNWNFDLEPENGIHTKRWLALNSVLPNNYANMTGTIIFTHIDAIPPETRAPYREQYLYLFDAESDAVDEVLAANPLPDDFQQHYSALPIAYYIGLMESESLATQVYAETLRANWQAMPSILIKRLWRDLTVDNIGFEFPTTDDLAQSYQPVTQPMLGFQQFEYIGETPPYAQTYWSDEHLFWVPGVRFFGVLRHIYFPIVLLTLFTTINTIYSITQMVQQRRFSVETVTPIALALGILAFIFASNIVLYFRDKELRFITPLLVAQVGITLGYLLPKAVFWLRPRTTEHG